MKKLLSESLTLCAVALVVNALAGCGDSEDSATNLPPEFGASGAGAAPSGSGGAGGNGGAPSSSGGASPGSGGNPTAGTGGTPSVGGAAGGGAIGGAGGGSGGSGGGPGPVGFPPVTDFAAPGPFPTTSSPEGPACTVFRPQSLGENGLRHPIILWGNGTTANPQIYAAALTHWASHGFIVAAADTSNAGTGQEMIGCLDYIIAQHQMLGSPYFGAVDESRVGTSGHSQGGGGSLMAGRDLRVTATAPLQPYTQQGFGGYDQASIGQQAGPMFLMSGSADLIAAPVPNQQRVFDGTNVPVFWGTLVGADHIVSAIGDITGYRGPATAWFRLHLMGDQSARPLFYGPGCGLCSDSTWTVQRRGI